MVLLLRVVALFALTLLKIARLYLFQSKIFSAAGGGCRSGKLFVTAASDVAVRCVRAAASKTVSAECPHAAVLMNSAEHQT